MALGPTDRLLSQLNQTQLAQKDNPVYQVIKQLIQRIKELENSLGGSSSSTTINETIQQFFMGGDSDSGSNGGDVVPGPIGPTGATGATGAMGPVTLGPMGLDADSPEEPWMIPGVIGPQGNQGPEGSHTLVMLGLDGYDGEDGQTIPSPSSSSSGSSPLEFIETRTCTGNAVEDFINLSLYSEIYVLVRNVTQSLSGQISLRISTDNGATFLAAGTDYIPVTVAGLEGSATSMTFHNTAATAARSEVIGIKAFNGAIGPKWAESITQTGGIYILPGTTTLNAVRVLTTGAGNLSGGAIFVYGRR